MAGGLVQLISVGVQDAYVQDDLSPSLFLYAYRKHTPFAVQPMDVDLTPQVVWGERVSVTLPRKGDLTCGMYLQVTMRKGYGVTYHPVESLVQSIELEIGSQVIDFHTSEWMRIRSDLFQTLDEKIAWRRLTDFSDGEAPGTLKTFWLPLSFAICTPAKALPLIAMSNHTAKLTFTFANAVRGIDPTYTPQIKLWVDYIFLGNAERERIAYTPREILIDQVQIQEERMKLIGAPQKQNMRLLFNLPVSYLVWACPSNVRHGKFAAGVEGETAEALAPIKAAAISFNGYERISMPASYFSTLHPFVVNGTAPGAGVYMYSFAQHPKDRSAATGSANFSRIDSVVLNLDLKGVNTTALQAEDLMSPDETVRDAAQEMDKVRIYACNWNVLRIANGTTSIAFVN